MMASWAGMMTTWTVPHADLPLFGTVEVTDAISTATPLASMKNAPCRTLPSPSCCSARPAASSARPAHWR